MREKQRGKGLMLQITSFPFYLGSSKAVDLMEWSPFGAGALSGESGPRGLVTCGWRHRRCVANKVLIGYQSEDESSYKQLVKRQHCTPKSCKCRALCLGGEVSSASGCFTARSWLWVFSSGGAGIALLRLSRKLLNLREKSDIYLTGVDVAQWLMFS